MLNAPSLSKQALVFLAKKTKVGIKCFEGESLPRSPHPLPRRRARHLAEPRIAERLREKILGGTLKLSGPLVPGPNCHISYRLDPVALWSHSSGIQLLPPPNLRVPVQPEIDRNVTPAILLSHRPVLACPFLEGLAYSPLLLSVSRGWAQALESLTCECPTPPGYVGTAQELRKETRILA